MLKRLDVAFLLGEVAALCIDQARLSDRKRVSTIHRLSQHRDLG